MAACSSGSASTTTEPALPSTTTTTEVTATTLIPQSPLPGFDVGWLRITGEEWLVAIADTPELRAQGLMGVEDLGSLKGMLFTFEEPSTGGFWMKDTVIPLDIAFFAIDGSLVDILSMVPCEADPCPSYTPSGPYSFALEARPGAFAAMDQPSLGSITRIEQ